MQIITVNLVALSLADVELVWINPRSVTLRRLDNGVTFFLARQHYNMLLLKNACHTVVGHFEERPYNGGFNKWFMIMKYTIK